MIYTPLGSLSFLLHALGLVLTIAVSVAVASWVDRQASDDAARAMVALLLVHATMATLVLGQLLLVSPAITGALSRTWYGLILASPVLWFLFAVYYTGRDHWLTTPVRVLLGVSAVGPFVLSMTNPLHRLLVTEWVLRTEPFRFRQAVFGDLNGPFFLLVSLYVLAGFALLFRLALFSRRSSRWQSLGLLAGMVVVQVSALLSVTEYVPITNFPYGIYGSGVFGVIVAVSLFHTRMFAVAPLARDTLFDSLDDAIVVVDTHRRVVDFNDRALDVFPGLDGEIGRQLDDACPALVGSTDWWPDVAASDTAGSNGGLARTNGDGRDPSPDPADDSDSPFASRIRGTVDGAQRSFNVTTSEITIGGNPRGYGLVVSDITDLVAYSTELEHKTERLEQFANALSHDLRNPVTVAMGNIELQREGGDSEHLRIAADALDRIEATIDDLLTLARSGEAVDDPAAVSLRSVVDDAWETSDTGDATLSADLDRSFRVRADRSRLRTLLENLFRNAADHGGQRVTVGPLTDGFYVADDGPGIPDDERERVFEYGYSTADDGTGFGLAIVRAVVEAHGWSIEVTESDDGGARFELTGVPTDDSPDDRAVGPASRAE